MRNAPSHIYLNNTSYRPNITISVDIMSAYYEFCLALA